MILFNSFYSYKSTTYPYPHQGKGEKKEIKFSKTADILFSI